jgi:hypothetical protein
MALRFQFDRKNKILLLRVEGPLTQEVLGEVMVAITAYSNERDVEAAIFDFSHVTEFALSTAFIQQLAKQKPSLANAANRRRVIVAPAGVGFGLARMFQTTGESTRPLLAVARTLDEAFEALGVQSPHFEPLG